VHGEASDVFGEEINPSAIGRDEAGYHVEGGRFTGAIGPEKSDDLARLDFEPDFIDNDAAGVGFLKSFDL
jgi:hypothetical protein